MKHYAIAELDVTDPGWVGDYVANVTGIVERCGGRYLARSTRIEKIEGEHAPPQVPIIEWPSKSSRASPISGVGLAPVRAPACRVIQRFSRLAWANTA